MSEHKGNPSDSWSHYWASGALTSLPEDFRANYDGEIRAFWRAQCEGLIDGCEVLDVCTGNGAVALLIAEELATMRISGRVVAIDRADIRPDQIRKRFPGVASLLDRIEFIANQPFETLAYADSSADRIFSQYGIEYCDLELAAAQCERILRPGGRLAIVTHAPDSAMLATMQDELQQFSALETLGLEALIAACFDPLAEEGEVKRRLNAARQSLHRLDGFGQSGLYGYVDGMLNHLIQLGQPQWEVQRPQVHAALQQLEYGRERLDQMLTVNQRLSQPDHGLQPFVNAGLEQIDTGTLRYRGQHDVGRWAIFHRP
jgi:SAM-dependent methyltransferase